MNEPLIELRGVGRAIPGGGFALRDATARIGRGENVAIVGPSGSGKTTLLSILGLLDRPSQGAYLFDGVHVASLDEASRDQLRGQRIGFVFQNSYLMADDSVADNVALPLRVRGVPAQRRHELVDAALARVDLSGFDDVRAGELSGGEKQRVAVARALVGAPDVILADEPTGALDADSTRRLVGLLRQINQSGTTVVVVTHDPIVAAGADRRLTLTDGVLTDDAPAQAPVAATAQAVVPVAAAATPDPAPTPTAPSPPAPATPRPPLLPAPSPTPPSTPHKPEHTTMTLTPTPRQIPDRPISHDPDQPPPAPSAAHQPKPTLTQAFTTLDEWQRVDAHTPDDVFQHRPIEWPVPPTPPPGPEPRPDDETFDPTKPVDLFLPVTSDWPVPPSFDPGPLDLDASDAEPAPPRNEAAPDRFFCGVDLTALDERLARRGPPPSPPIPRRTPATPAPLVPARPVATPAAATAWPKPAHDDDTVTLEDLFMDDDPLDTDPFEPAPAGPAAPAHPCPSRNDDWIRPTYR